MNKRILAAGAISLGVFSPMRFLLIFISVMLLPGVSFSQQSGTITGTVLDQSTQEPLAGAAIQLRNTKLGAISGRDGKFTIRNAPAGVQSLRASLVGYEARLVSDLVVSSGKPVTVTIELKEKISETGAVEVEANYFRNNAETITSTQLLNAEDVRRMPGGQEDVIRTVSLLPGVGVTQAGRNDLVVRGGAPFENLFIVDNIEIPNINHFGSQGSTGGPLSLINIDFVRETRFSAGGFGVRFGDKLSSLTEIQLREGNEERVGGELNLSATGFGAIAEGPLGSQGSFLLSARRSYLDLIFKAAGLGFIPEYWDFQSKLVWRPDTRNSISFLTIGALNSVALNNDELDRRYTNSRVAIPNQKQYFSGVSWKHLFENGFSTVTLGRTFNDFDTYQNDSLLNTIFRNRSLEGENSLRAEFFYYPSAGIEINAGNTLKYASQLRYDILIPGFLRRDADFVPQELRADTSFTALRNGSFASISVQLGESLKLGAGVRMDYYGFLKDRLYFSPRVSASYALDASSSLNLSAGRYYQSPSFIWLIGDPGNSDALKALRSDQIVLGYESIVRSDLKLQVEAYYKWYGNYPGRIFRPQAVLAPSGFDDIQNDIPFGLEPLSPDARGFARGFEIFLQKKFSDIPCYGLITLSLNETRFRSLDGSERPGSYDTRAIFNIAGGYRFWENWEASAKFRLASGLPTTPFITEGPALGTPDFANYNAGQRLSVFHALDVRIDRRWEFSGLQLTTYIDIQNLYGRKNVSGVRWNQRTGRAERQETIGILPSIGVNIEF